MATWYNSPNLQDESHPVRALLLHDRIFPSEEWAQGHSGDVPYFTCTLWLQPIFFFLCVCLETTDPLVPIAFFFFFFFHFEF